MQFVTALQMGISTPPYKRNQDNILLRGENCSRARNAHQFWIFKEKIVQKSSVSSLDLIFLTKCTTESCVANYQFVMESLFSDMESILWLVLCLIVEYYKSKLCFDEDIQSFEDTIFNQNEENNFVVFDGIFGLFFVRFLTKTKHRHHAELLVNSCASLFLLNITIISPVRIPPYHKNRLSSYENFLKKKMEIFQLFTTCGENASFQHFKPLFLFLLCFLSLKNRLIVVKKVLTSRSSCVRCLFVPVFADFIFEELEKCRYCQSIAINSIPRISSKSTTIVSALFSCNDRRCYHLRIFVDCRVI